MNRVEFTDRELAVVSFCMGIAAAACPDLVDLAEVRAIGKKLLIPDVTDEQAEMRRIVTGLAHNPYGDN